MYPTNNSTSSEPSPPKIQPPIKIRRVFVDITDLSCKPAGIEISKVAEYATENAIVITPNIEEADLIVVNTCAVDKKHEDLTCSTIEDVYRQKNPTAEVVSIGCLNFIDRQLLKQRFPLLRLVTNLDDFKSIFASKRAFDKAKRWVFDENIFQHRVERGPQPLFKSTSIYATEALSNLVKDSKVEEIQELHIPQIKEEITRENKTYVLIGRGCVGNCSYCAIKKAQGNPKSRTASDIVQDIRNVYQPGWTICLSADDCTSWGVDMGDDFPNLVDTIAREFPGIEIDIGYLNPLFMEKHTERCIEMFRNVAVNNVNISLQSGCERILRLMNRRYRIDRLLDNIETIKDVSPSTMIWTHCIVGFPSETWSEYLETLRVLDHFHYYNIYPFSARRGTTGETLNDQKSLLIREIRARIAYARLVGRVGYHTLKGFTRGNGKEKASPKRQRTKG